MRNHVEGKFGKGKNGYDLDQIRARRNDTSESWISAILFVMNLTRLMKVVVMYGYFLALSILEVFLLILQPILVFKTTPGKNHRVILT